MLCSMLCSATRLTTVTERVWFLRQALAMRLELGGIPRQIDVDDGACDLQVEADAAAVGRQKQPAGGVALEAVDFGAAPLLRQRTGVPGRLDAHFQREF